MVLSLILQVVSNMLLPTIISIIAAVAFYYIKVVMPKRKILSKIPVQFPELPIIGASVYMERGGVEFRKQLHEFCFSNSDNQKAGICALWIGFHPIVLLWKAPYFDTILSSHEIKKSYLYRFFRCWLGEGLLTSFGDKWRDHRKLLTHSFHFRILNDYIPIMNEHAENLVQTIEKSVGKGEVDIFPLVIMSTLNIICEAAMGQSTGEEDRKARERFFTAVIELSHIVHIRQKNPQMWPDKLFAMTSMGMAANRHLKAIQDYTEKIFQERAATFDKAAVESLMKTDDETGGNSKKRRPLPFLDSLLYSCDNFTKLSKQDIKDEVNTFLFTGHDTTAASTAFTLYLLARHPEAQKKVQAELDEIFGSSNRPVTADDIRKMRYLSACLKESLRLYPVAPIYARELTNDMQFGEYNVPAGTTVMLLNEILHRDPEYFEDPLAFKPERFLVTSGDADADDIPAGAKIHPFAYVPFSGGQRNCIGQKYAQMEDKILISSVMRRFWLECNYTEEQLAPAVEVILRPTKGIFVRASYR